MPVAAGAEPGNGVGATFLSLGVPRRIEPQAVVASLPARCDVVGLVEDEGGDPVVLERERGRDPSVPGADDDDAGLSHSGLP